MNQPSLKTKLNWQCRRGMLELDVILIPFLEKHFDSLDETHQELFRLLLTQEDPDLYTWLMGYGKCDDANLNRIVQMIREKTGITS